MSGFRCLAIETATQVSSVAVCLGAHVESLQLEDARSSSRQLYQSLRQLLQQASLQLADLDCIAFGCGPGSFTGVRVAAGAAQALAYSLRIPVCRVSTLAAMAAVARRQSAAQRIAVCLDARMGELYAGQYSAADMTALGPDQLLTPGDYILPDGSAASGKWLAAGNGWAEFPAVLERNRASLEQVMTDVWPDAAAIIELARDQYARAATVTAADALPNYLRDQVTQ